MLGMLKEENKNLGGYEIMDSVFPPALKMLYLEKYKNGHFEAFETTPSKFRTSPTSTSAELNDRIRQSARLYAAFPLKPLQITPS